MVIGLHYLSDLGVWASTISNDVILLLVLDSVHSRISKYVDFTYFVICMVVQRARSFKTRDFETTNGNWYCLFNYTNHLARLRWPSGGPLTKMLTPIILVIASLLPSSVKVFIHIVNTGCFISHFVIIVRTFLPTQSDGHVIAPSKY